MGTALIKLKVMPSSPDTNLEEIKNKAKELIENNNGKNIGFEEEAIAFGLKAIIISFAIDESQELDPIEEAIKQIPNTNSVQLIDMRRALE